MVGLRGGGCDRPAGLETTCEKHGIFYDETRMHNLLGKMTFSILIFAFRQHETNIKTVSIPGAGGPWNRDLFPSSL